MAQHFLKRLSLLLSSFQASTRRKVVSTHPQHEKHTPSNFVFIEMFIIKDFGVVCKASFCSRCQSLLLAEKLGFICSRAPDALLPFLCLQNVLPFLPAKLPHHRWREKCTWQKEASSGGTQFPCTQHGHGPGCLEQLHETVYLECWVLTIQTHSI